ncbi:MAG TPA: hypothetical protein VG079_06840 [Gaiellaceae bacterium]|nr:hypothetical protein [Gaiellaceae bacterium]
MANPGCIYCGREISAGLAGLSLACHDCRHPLHGSWAPPWWWPNSEKETGPEPPDADRPAPS